MNKVYKEYEFVKDYPLAGKKKGEKIKLASVSKQLYDYVKELAPANEETPTEKWKNEDIIIWLAAHEVPDAKGTKEELLKEVKKVLKAK